MRYYILSRSDLALVLSETVSWKRRAFKHELSFEPSYAPDKNNVWLCWPDTNSANDDFPYLIVIGDNDVNDFLAWAVTFLPTYRPLTSFFRVIPWSLFLAVRQKTDSVTPENEILLIGTILSEALASGTTRGFIDSLPLTAFESTYSWVISRTIMLGLNARTVSHVSASWASMRELSGQTSRKIAISTLEAVWEIILHLIDKNSETISRSNPNETYELIVSCCLDIKHSGRISALNWESISGGRFHYLLMDDYRRSAKENRVEIFELVLKSLLDSPYEEIRISFLIGYMASLISDGSLEHAHLIVPLQEKLPSAMLWYGICGALLPESRLLVENGHLGIKMLRLLKRGEELMSVPSCDISLPELKVILRGEPKSRLFRQLYSSSLRVELAPMVTAVTRLPATSSNNNNSEQQGLLIEDEKTLPLEAERLKELVKRLEGTLALAESLINRKQPQTTQSVSSQRGKKRR